MLGRLLPRQIKIQSLFLNTQTNPNVPRPNGCRGASRVYTLASISALRSRTRHYCPHPFTITSRLILLFYLQTRLACHPTTRTEAWAASEPFLLQVLSLPTLLLHLVCAVISFSLARCFGHALECIASTFSDFDRSLPTSGRGWSCGFSSPMHRVNNCLARDLIHLL